MWNRYLRPQSVPESWPLTSLHHPLPPFTHHFTIFHHSFPMVSPSFHQESRPLTHQCHHGLAPSSASTRQRKSNKIKAATKSPDIKLNSCRCSLPLAEQPLKGWDVLIGRYLLIHMMKNMQKKHNWNIQQNMLEDIYTLWIQTLSQKLLNPLNHTPNTSQQGTQIHRDI